MRKVFCYCWNVGGNEASCEEEVATDTNVGGQKVGASPNHVSFGERTVEWRQAWAFLAKPNQILQETNKISHASTAGCDG